MPPLTVEPGPGLEELRQTTQELLSASIHLHQTSKELMVVSVSLVSAATKDLESAQELRQAALDLKRATNTLQPVLGFVGLVKGIFTWK